LDRTRRVETPRVVILLGFIGLEIDVFESAYLSAKMRLERPLTPFVPPSALHIFVSERPASPALPLPLRNRHNDVLARVHDRINQRRETP
jgi:hypothetical protein